MPRAGSALAICIAVAATQYGIISAAQAAAEGVSADAIHRLVLSRSLTRVLPSVYALWIPSGGDELWRHRLAAGALWLGEGSAVSRRAAAMLWHLDGIDSAPAEFCTVGRRRSSDPSLKVHRTRSLSADEIVRIGLLPVTSVTRTLLDICAVVRPKSVELALESALRRGLVTIPKLAEALDRSGRTHAGRGVLRLLLNEFPDEATESALEALLWRCFREQSVPLPSRQHEVRDRAGRLVARLDFAYPECLLAIEADGDEFHSSRQQRLRDRARQNALIGMGWTVFRVAWEDVVRHPRKVADDVQSLLGRCARNP
ncbi:MAG: DUF559 domain-containing protein [Actinomycetota bacterium]